MAILQHLFPLFLGPYQIQHDKKKLLWIKTAKSVAQNHKELMNKKI